MTVMSPALPELSPPPCPKISCPTSPLRCAVATLLLLLIHSSISAFFLAGEVFAIDSTDGLSQSSAASDTVSSHAVPKGDVVADNGAAARGAMRDAPAGDVLIEITDIGLPTPFIRTRFRQGMMLFFNNSTSSLLTLDIEFGEKALTCFSSATPNLQFAEGGKLVSTRPIAPGNFASTCFPRPGSYGFTVYGVRGKEGGVRGMIEVSVG